MRSRRSLTLLTCALVALATAGLAEGALKERSATVELEAEETGSATAACGGARAVSGGFDDPGFNAAGPSGSFASTFTSRRASKREWTSVFTNGFGVDPATAFTYVYCSKELPRLKTISSTATVPAGEVASVTARCPKGGEAVSGGFDAEQTAPYFGSFPYGSRRVGKRKWVATGFSDNGTELTSYAYCAKRKLGLKARSATAAPRSNDNATAEARCKKGERVISGGFQMDLDDGLFADLYESRRTGRRAWTASTGAFADFAFEVFAYCLKKDKKR